MSVLTHPIRFHGERGRWLVPSESQPAVPNFVDMDEEDGAGQCSCDDWKFRHERLGPRYQCRHIKAVITEIEMLTEWMAFPIDNFTSNLVKSSHEDFTKKTMAHIQRTP